MIDLKDMQCLTALARHRHFARAADSCGLSQPAFSMRIRGVEERLGAKIVRRGNRFQGFTAEGESVVGHARRVLDEVRAMEQDLRAARGEVSGAIVLGVVPTAAAFAAGLTRRLTAAHAGVAVRIETANSLTIQQGIADQRFDAGLTYADSVPTELLTCTGLYEETYVLLCPEALAPRRGGQATWAEAAALPLTLLAPDMQNRRILDQVFTEIGAEPHVVAETSGHITALAMVAGGGVATVVPQVLVDGLGAPADTVVLPLVDPQIARTIGLVTAAHASGLPVLEALRDAARPR